MRYYINGNKFQGRYTTMKRFTAFLLCFLIIASICTCFAFADERPENGWYDYDKYYTMEPDGKIYPWRYYYQDGKVTRGWEEIDGKWYYFADGAIDSGFLYRETRVGKYYVGLDGAMVTNQWKKDLKITYHNTFLDERIETYFEPYDPVRWRYFGSDGKQTEGWAWIDGRLYYFIEENEDEDLIGVLQTGWFEDDSGKYYLTEYGAKTAQWLEDEETGEWSYFKPTGALAKDEWVQVKTKWYLFDENGIMLTGEQERDGKSYLLSDSGAMYTGWKQLDDGSWIYYKADGAMAKDEWVMVKNKWYLFDAEGIMRTGLLERYDHTYYFNDNGSMATGWKKLDGVWYYFRPADHANGPQGSMVKDSWVLSGNKWYYIGSDGIMVTGTKDIYSGNYGKSDEYYFNDSGAMQTGWHHVNGNWHFYRTSSSANGPQGSMAKGVWVPAGSFWYFTDYTDGAMVLGWQDIEGKRYYFSDDANHYGQMVTGKQVIDGKEYTFDDDGALVK